MVQARHLAPAAAAGGRGFSKAAAPLGDGSASTAKTDTRKLSKVCYTLLPSLGATHARMHGICGCTVFAQHPLSPGGPPTLPLLLLLRLCPAVACRPSWSGSCSSAD